MNPCMFESSAQGQPGVIESQAPCQTRWPGPIRLALIACVAVLMGVAGCGGSAVPPATVPAPVSATIGAAGGTIIGPDGVQLVIPPGALEADVTLTISRSSAGAPSLPEGVSPNLPIYEITPHGQLFNVPVQVKIPSSVAAGTDVVAWVANPGGPWSTLPVTIVDGFLVMERNSLSFYSGTSATLACTPAPGDPHPCRRAGMAAADARRPVQATPSSALRYDERSIPSPNGGPSVLNTSMVLSQNATLSVPLNFGAAADCRNGELTVQSYFDPAAPGPSTPLQTILRQPIALSAPAPGSPEALAGGISVGNFTFQTAVSNLPRGRQYYIFSFSCTRDFMGYQQFASGFLNPIFVELPAQGVAPTFTQPPASTQVVAGQPASFSAIAQSTPAPAIRWQVAPAAGAFVDVAGEAGCAATPAPASGTQTTASCTIANTPVGNSGQRYRAVATNTAALGGVNSAEATLTITPAPVAPTITQGPVAQSAFEFADANFTVAATGTATLAYTWRINGVNLPSANGPFSALPGNACRGDVTYTAGNASVTLSNLSAGCTGVSVSVVVSNSANPPATSGPALLTVIPASASWVQQHIGAANDNFLGIDAFDVNTVWAVGGGGTIKRTTDGGATWVAQTSGTTTDLHSVSAVSSNVAWVVGDGTILKTIDGGATWVAQSGATGRTLLKVSAVDATTAWAVGYLGVIMKTTDGGATWVTQRGPIRGLSAIFELYSVATVDATTAWTVGNNKILKTVDGGANWVVQTPPPCATSANAIFGSTPTYGNGGVIAVNASSAWVACTGGLLRTVNGGASWTFEILPGSPEEVLSIAGNASELWVVVYTGGNAPKPFKSTNGGVTGSWIAQPPMPQGLDFGKVFDVIGGGPAWTTGRDGDIRKR